jgi:dTDP-glucose 4,6-dehydratase
MKKILITGGSGFIGTNFINFISSKKHKILNIDKISSVSTPDNFKKIFDKKKYLLLKNNLEDSNKIFNILNKFKPDYIVNFAAESHVDRSINDPIYFIKNNINSASNLFHAYCKYYKKMKIKLFHISTDEVYGSITRGEFKENDTYYPSSPYSASKGCADLIAASFNRTYGAEIKILNLTNNYGPYQFPEKFIPTLISYFLKSKQAPIYGKGKNIREWMHVEDSCNAIWKSVISKKKFEKMNIGSGVRVSNLEIANLIFKIMKSKNLTKLKSTNFLKMVKDRPGHDERYALNTNFFKKNIKYTMKKNLYVGLNETIIWYIKNNEWVKNVNKSYNFKRLGLID